MLCFIVDILEFVLYKKRMFVKVINENGRVKKYYYVDIRFWVFRIIESRFEVFRKVGFGCLIKFMLEENIMDENLFGYFCIFCIIKFL